MSAGGNQGPTRFPTAIIGLSTFGPEIAPSAGFTFNQSLALGEIPYCSRPVRRKYFQPSVTVRSKHWRRSSQDWGPGTRSPTRSEGRSSGNALPGRLKCWRATHHAVLTQCALYRRLVGRQASAVIGKYCSRLCMLEGFVAHAEQANILPAPLRRG
jgi:hypothetical protein